MTNSALGAASGTSLPGRIGPYTIIRQIGEGGFGAVYLAEQLEPVKRTVALKILKLGMDTREVVARFEQERQALALMDHSNIARVIDAGATESGRPYFVMDFVEGLPIAQYCDGAHLPVDARLDLFAQVCDAVQHAHGKGIIHRDLKPSNILVAVRDGKPSARIIDFGIAKAVAQKLTDKTVFTEDRQVIGTVQYMSPEQAAGSLDIDTRTDIYALGVVLYELLTGSTPFDANALRAAMFGEIQRMIREVDPPRPSTRLRQSSDTIASIAALRSVEARRRGSIVRGELDWIVMKALEKERGRRYATAAGFAEDLRRYLSGEAVVAAPPSAIYRARKFVRKNGVAVGAATAVLVSLVAGVVAFASQARIARRERDRAVAAEAETKKRADELRLVSDFQSKMLEKIDVPQTGKDLAQSLRTKQAAALAESGVPEPDRPVRTQTFEEELARVNSTDAAMGVIDGAILKPAIDAVGKQFGDQPLVAATLRQTLADVYRRFGKYEQSLPLQESALETRRTALGNDHPDTLKSINQLANLLDRQSAFARAEPLYREALDGWRRVRGAESKEAQGLMTNLGGNLRFQAKNAEAEPMLRESFELGKRVYGEDARETLVCENILGFLLIDQGRLAETEPLWRDSYERGKKAFGPQDTDVLTWANNLGSVLNSMGRLAEAEPYYREAYEGYRRMRGEEHPATLSCASSVATILWKQGKLAEAETLAQKTLEARQRVIGPEHINTLQAMKLVGAVLRSEGKLSEAEPLLRESLEIGRRVLGPQHIETLKFALAFAQLLEAQGKLEEAMQMYDELLATPKSVWRDENPDRLVVMSHLGMLWLGAGRAGEAETLLREALATRARVSGPEHPETLIVQNCVGKVLAAQGKFEEAERELLEAERLLASAQGVSARVIEENRKALVELYEEWEKADPGKGHGERALDRR